MAGAGSSQPIDHCTDEIVGWHVAKKGDRWVAPEPIRQGAQEHFGMLHAEDRPRARQFDGELKWLDIRSSPAFVGEPECNGLIERFMRTLKEECLYIHRLRSLEHARQVVADFVGRYNREGSFTSRCCQRGVVA